MRTIRLKVIPISARVPKARAAAAYFALVAWAVYPLFRLSLLGVTLDPVLWIVMGIAVWQSRKEPVKTVTKVPYYER